MLAVTPTLFFQPLATTVRFLSLCTRPSALDIPYQWGSRDVCGLFCLAAPAQRVPKASLCLAMCVSVIPFIVE